ncbi:MAG: hypothetical protein M1831_004804 [Alyxoria varia]|nr:MAG: hypothetical protein M1831_004804 [Alyxoria varia]
MASHFKSLQQLKIEYCDTDFALYESERTGLRVIIVRQEGPKTYGHFAVATEIHDDSGSPHTLEHLVFMGSKNYRYKGFLDQLATRAFSDTNAWTDVDATVYTLDSVGWDGFLTLLPVYLDHILIPTLTDAGCYTEVHHIAPDGNDAGVVYSEMQATQNTQSSLIDTHASRLQYSKSNGYRYETGGLMDSLRSLTAERIREFHREMYQPKNLCLVLTGEEIDHKRILSVLDKFEDGILEHVPRLDEPFHRPWVKTGKSDALKESITDTVEFPDEDETTGEIEISYFGPDYDDDIQGTAMMIFLSYICGSSIALLENVLVETEQLASMVEYSVYTRPNALIQFCIASVNTDIIEKVKHRFFEVLEEAASKPIDMQYLTKCLKRYKRQVKFFAEISAKIFSESFIYDHLFGNRDGSELRKLTNLDDFDTLEKWSGDDWLAFFKRWFIEAKHVTVIGKPSKALSEKIEKDDKARVHDRKEKLGGQGLKELERRLKEAQEENDRKIPKELLKSFPAPSANSVHFIQTETALAGLARPSNSGLKNKAQEAVDKDADLPNLFLHFEHISTNFVSIGVILCTHAIPQELRPLLSVYIMNFFTTPIKEAGGRRIEYEEIVEKLEEDTVSYDCGSGASLDNSEVVRISFQIEPDKYETAIKWIKTMMHDSIFDVTRLMASTTKLISTIVEEKRSGSDMAHAVTNFTHTTRDSTSRSANTLIKSKYLIHVLKKLQDSPDEAIADFEKVREALMQPSNMRVFVTADLVSGAIAKPVSAWKLLVGESHREAQLKPLDSSKSTLSPAAETPGDLAYVVPIPAIDSSFAVIACRGPDSYDHPKLAALAVAQGYLDAIEGPLWVAVRGTGLAYGTGFSRNVDKGILQYSIYRSPNAATAFSASRKVVQDLANGIVPIDDLALEGAKSSVVVSFANEQPTKLGAATISFVYQVIKDLPKDWAQAFMEKVQEVGPEDVKQALKDIILPVFEPKSSNLIVTCARVMEEKLTKSFEEQGFKPEVKKLSEFQDDYGLGDLDEGGVLDLEDDEVEEEEDEGEEDDE